MTNKNPSPATRFTPGHGSGRPRGSRNRITDKFLEVLGADFDDNAAEVIRTVRAEDATSYLKIVAHLLPRSLEAHLQVEQQVAPGNLDPAERATLRRILEIVQATAPGAPAGHVFDVIESALRVEFARTIDHEPLAIEHQAAPPLLTIDAEPEPIAATLPRPPY